MLGKTNEAAGVDRKHRSPGARCAPSRCYAHDGTHRTENRKGKEGTPRTLHLSTEDRALHGLQVLVKIQPESLVKIQSARTRKGRWVEIEYYHWLHEEYRTGWVLKHYLERVPASYSKNEKE